MSAQPSRNNMISTPASNTLPNALANLEEMTPRLQPNHEDEPAAKRQHFHSPERSTTPKARLDALGGNLGRLPAELRNTVYSHLLTSSSSFFIVPTVSKPGKFKLRERSDGDQYAVLANLQSLRFTSRAISLEARTYLYAKNEFSLLCYGYEYLPVFVCWLESIGKECRALLRTVLLHGSMWYLPDDRLTHRLHELLREGRNTRQLTIQFNLMHLCENSGDVLAAYLNGVGPEPHDGPLPDVGRNVDTWVSTVASMPELRSFELDLVISIDGERVKAGEETVNEFTQERGRVLARDMERRLGKALGVVALYREVAVKVRYRGAHVRRYYVPWE